MNTRDLNCLISFAEACRRGLESLSNQPHSMFHGFPTASCGPAAELIGRLLKERISIDGHYVCGDHHPSLSPNHSHAWFEANGYIIDITHDQFSHTGTTGWVLPLDSAWHASFCNVQRREGFCLPHNWPNYPHDGYRAMKAALETRWNGQPDFQPPPQADSS